MDSLNSQRRYLNRESEVETRSSSRVWIFLPLLTLIAGALLYGAYLYIKKSEVVEVNNTQVVPDNSEEVGAIVDQVSKLVVLPRGETPTIATVSDPTQLEEQDFFEEAEVGDKVLIYEKAKKVVLYRPSINLVVNIASIQINATN